MALDFNILYDLKYNTNYFAVTAALTPVGGDPVTLVVVDYTKGVEVSPAADLNTVRPVADVRASALAALGVARAGLRGSTLVMNGTTWKIADHEVRPSPLGEAAGEYRLHLTLASP